MIGNMRGLMLLIACSLCITSYAQNYAYETIKSCGDDRVTYKLEDAFFSEALYDMKRVHNGYFTGDRYWNDEEAEKLYNKFKSFIDDEVCKKVLEYAKKNKLQEENDAGLIYITNFPNAEYYSNGKGEFISLAFGFDLIIYKSRY